MGKRGRPWAGGKGFEGPVESKMPERTAQPQNAKMPPAASPGASPAPGRLQLNVTSDPANLAPVRRACEAFCVGSGLDAAAAGDVGLCVNEAMANITRHAYSGATDKPIEVTGWSDGGGVHVALRDWGSGELPPTRVQHDPLTPGGLGLICLRKLLDDVVYTPQPNGMLVTMTRRTGGRCCCG